MNGSSNYNYIDNTRDTDTRNLGYRGLSPVGALIHTTSGSDSLSWLTVGAANSGKPASANFLIERNGTQHRLCTREKYPYHAGVSRLEYNNRLYQGDEISQLLIGIELENLDTTLCTYQQLDSLAEVIVQEGLYYGWRWPYYVLGHYEVALPIGRRSDPLGFRWGDFAGRLYARAVSARVGGV